MCIYLISQNTAGINTYGVYIAIFERILRSLEPILAKGATEAETLWQSKDNLWNTPRAERKRGPRKTKVETLSRAACVRQAHAAPHPENPLHIFCNSPRRDFLEVEKGVFRWFAFRQKPKQAARLGRLKPPALPRTFRQLTDVPPAHKPIAAIVAAITATLMRYTVSPRPTCPLNSPTVSYGMA